MIYYLQTLTRQRPRERSTSRPESRSFPPSLISTMSPTEASSTENVVHDDHTANEDEEEAAFFQRPSPPPPQMATTHQQPPQILMDQATMNAVKDDEVTSSSIDNTGRTLDHSISTDNADVVTYVMKKKNSFFYRKNSTWIVLP